MATPQKVTPIKGVDYDNAPAYIEELRAIFMKNITSNVNDNPGSSTKEGSNQYSFTPLEMNKTYCNLTLPAGTNYVVGFGYFIAVNQAYVCVWNSNNNHFIYRIKGNNGTCEIVYKNACLNFQLVPKYFVTETRMTLEKTCRFNKVKNLDEDVLYLFIVDKFNSDKMICVEDSINTHFFSKDDFPYFDVNDDSCTPCSYIDLGLAQNLDCIGIDPVPREIDDTEEMLKLNMINKAQWQFRVKPIDVWRRESEHGVISYPYISVVGGPCIEASSGLSRCLKLTFKAGCPIIDKWQIEFRKWSGNVHGLSVESDWSLFETIDKYNNCQDKNWWERAIANEPDQNWTYNPVNNTITYTFCADKGCQALPVNETNRNENYLPLTSGGIMSLSNRIALLDNERGFEPLDCNELSKLKITVEKPVPNSTCVNSKLIHVTIYGVIYNDFDNATIPIRYQDATPVFGIADCPANNPFAYDQVFPKDQLGFVGYMAGTSNYCVSKQYKYDRITGTEEFAGGVYDGGGLAGAFRFLPLQKWEFDLLPGRYVFRVASHKSKPTDNYQKTSTYVIGRTTLNAIGGLIEETKEIIIDVCGADEVKILNEPIMIYDLTRKGKGCAVADATNVNAGYLYEDEIDKRPIELAVVSPNVGGSAVRTTYTDHNGFYFTATRQRGLQTTLYGKKNCVNNTELGKSSTSYDTSGSWYKFNIIYVYKGTNKYLTKDRALIKGKIVLCDNPNIGVAGALVVLTRGGFTTTNEQGEFTIPAHDIGNQDVRVDKLVYSQKGSCVLITCGPDCFYCFPFAAVVIPICAGVDRVITVPQLSVRINGYNKKGPGMGGRHGVGMVLHDWLGRETYVQMQEKHYIDIPTLQETQVWDYSKIKFDITGINFPLWVKKVSFWITEDLNKEDYLSWVGERIQFVDNTGKPNAAAPTRIRIYYEGLNEYNKQNDLSTNAVWDFIANTTTGASVIGDEIEIVANGDGVIYNHRIVEQVTYDKIGKYVAIPYSAELAGLKDGCLIKLIRLKTCQQQEFFYELCPMIKVIDGIPQTLIGYLQFYNSYLLNRQIPVPVTTTTTTTDADNNEIITSVTENQLRNFPFLFEHHSPSDFWGDHAWSKGRVNVKNPLEAKKCRRTEISVGKAITLDNLLNGLNYFDDSDSKIFEEQDWGAFIAAFAEPGQVLVICETKAFAVPFNDTTVRQNEDGTLYAPSFSNRFGQPRKLAGGDFGVHPEDINTIRKGRAGIVIAICRNEAALIVFDFGSAVDVSTPGFVKSYISSNIKAMIAANGGDAGRKKYMHSVIDPKAYKYILTLATISQYEDEYGNDRPETSAGLNDTIVFDIRTKTFDGNRSYTPEYYGSMNGDINDQQLLSFKFGAAWLHNKINDSSALFCNFYGTQYTPYFEFVFNLDNAKEKKFMWLETYCKQILLYADRIVTSSGQVSRLMPKWWEKADKFWKADLKCAVNTTPDVNMPKETGPNALLDGDSLYGEWIKIRLRPKQGDRGKYFEFIAMICFMNGSEKSGE